ncbi:MAG: asparagine synthase C-terminal domain-containing protein [Thermoplasmatales archaeon]
MEWEGELKGALVSSAGNLPPNGVVLFSGGLDSSLIALLARNLGKKISLFSSGIRGSHDYYWSREAASILKMPLKFLEQGEKDVIEGLRDVKRVTGENNAMTLLIELPLYFSCKNSEEDVMISGQGADELFQGYKKYETIDSSEIDLNTVINKMTRLDALIAEKFGKEVTYPYLESRVVSVARAIPRDLKIREGQRKFILRTVAENIGLDSRIAWKPKKAAQYSTGFKKIVEGISKRSGMEVHQFISSL